MVPFVVPTGTNATPWYNFEQCKNDNPQTARASLRQRAQAPPRRLQSRRPRPPDYAATRHTSQPRSPVARSLSREPAATPLPRAPQPPAAAMAHGSPNHWPEAARRRSTTLTGALG